MISLKPKKQIRKQFGSTPLNNKNYGKIINEKHFTRICNLIDPSKVVCGGDNNPGALQIAPTVMDNVTFGDAVMQEEIFGPVLPVLTYDSLDEAIEKVNSMAHPLGALYDTPHGVANAIILPTVMAYNAEATGEKYRDIAKAMGVEGTENMSQEEYRKAAVDAVQQLSVDVGIPADLKEIVKEEDIPFLAQSAYDDACRPGNPKETSVEDITALYKKLL